MKLSALLQRSPISALKLNIALIILAACAAASAQSPNVHCQQNSPGSITCQVQYPNVTQHDTSYPGVQFAPGDTVSVTANGCVQTGGSGLTWKRYVDPSGDNSDHLYFGLISLPGATNGLIRISDAINKTYQIPKNYSGDLSLHLGYQDDNYSDNGYWSHDDGTGGQCANVGAASVTVFITRSQGAPTPPPVATPSHLHLNIGGDPLIPGVLQLTQSGWTVTASWVPGQTFTASGTHTTIDFPSTPPAGNDLVTIHLAFTATASGTINGADFNGVTTQAAGIPDPALVHMQGTDYTVGYFANYMTGTDANGKPSLVVYVQYEGGQSGKLILHPGLIHAQQSNSADQAGLVKAKPGAAPQTQQKSTLQKGTVDLNLIANAAKLALSQSRYRAFLTGTFPRPSAKTPSWKKLPLDEPIKGNPVR
jgi:hypothetical protein